MSPMAEWFLVLGLALLVMATLGRLIEDMPLTPAIVYLVLGYLIGRSGALTPVLSAPPESPWIEAATEVMLTLSLFAVGLRIRVPFNWRTWKVPICLALPAMVLTIAFVAVAARFGLGLSWGAAIVLGAIIAPTDPVLASDVQVSQPGDPSLVRFGLTAEGGTNDGLALPMLLFGLGTLGIYDLGPFGGRWLVVDVLWLVLAGCGVGWASGQAVGRLVLYLRSRHELALGWEEFLALGLMGVAYGAASLLGGSPFLSVFTAGLALRHIERRSSDAAGIVPEEVSIDDDSAETERDTAPVYMTRLLLDFNIQIERLAEAAIVILIGALLPGLSYDWRSFALAGFVLFVARPLAVWLTFARSGLRRGRLLRLAWFGIRGVGSLYYLAYSLRDAAMVGHPGRCNCGVHHPVHCSARDHGDAAHAQGRGLKLPSFPGTTVARGFSTGCRRAPIVEERCRCPAPASGGSALRGLTPCIRSSPWLPTSGRRANPMSATSRPCRGRMCSTWMTRKRTTSNCRWKKSRTPVSKTPRSRKSGPTKHGKRRSSAAGTTLATCFLPRRKRTAIRTSTCRRCRNPRPSANAPRACTEGRPRPHPCHSSPRSSL
jgi:sodium/hydrogen antiporter